MKKRGRDKLERKKQRLAALWREDLVAERDMSLADYLARPLLSAGYAVRNRLVGFWGRACD
jgi:hypothetical protein